MTHLTLTREAALSNVDPPHPYAFTNFVDAFTIALHASSNFVNA